ncbi:MAG: hypothetical protein F3741_01580 [Nitrospinae bacterium]|nr:hypothetical protein [Nitrospinota bacterium]MZH40247.1 hypothetical protein [Nitrospinota bacterium]
MIRPKIKILKEPTLLPSEASHYLETLMKVKRFAEFLLHQQLWCFGKDINSPNSNLLVKYGFKKVRPPEDKSGSTNYIFRTIDKVGDEVSMVLWGFGIYYGYGNNKCIYIGRYDVYPKLIHDEPLSLPAWAPSKLPEMKTPQSSEEWEYSFMLMSELFEWIARYEKWTNWVMDSSYREVCLKEWDQSIVSGNEMAWAWNKVANFFRKHLVCTEVPRKNIIPDLEKLRKPD